MYCQNCGKVMKLKLFFDGTTNTGVRSYVCDCGATSSKDPAGLHYSNIIDRYGFTPINNIVEKKYGL